MKETMKKLLIALMVFSVMFGVLSHKAYAEEETEEEVQEADREVEWNEWGECLWAVVDGCLTIKPSNSESGVLAGWEGQYEAPWYPQKDEITSVKIESKVKATTCAYMFNELSEVTQMDLSGLDTSSVTDMNGMFAWCGKLTAIDVSGFDTSNVTDMNGMFGRCTSLETLDLSNFVTDNVEDMMAMFVGDEALKELDLSNFNTGNVKSMHGMFQQCYELKTLDISGFDTGKVNNMGRMFQFCKSLTELDLSSFETTNVVQADGMLLNTESLIYLKTGNKFCANADEYGEFYRDLYSSYDDSLKEEGMTIPYDIDATVAYTVRYNVMYDGLDGEFNTLLYYKESAGIINDGSALTPPETRAATRDGKVFKGWDIKPDATTVVFTPGQAVSFKQFADAYGETVSDFATDSERIKTLYPVWGDPTPTPTPTPTPDTPYTLPKTGIDGFGMSYLPLTAAVLYLIRKVSR